MALSEALAIAAQLAQVLDTLEKAVLLAVFLRRRRAAKTSLLLGLTGPGINRQVAAEFGLRLCQ